MRYVLRKVRLEAPGDGFEAEGEVVVLDTERAATAVNVVYYVTYLERVA